MEYLNYFFYCGTVVLVPLLLLIIVVNKKNKEYKIKNVFRHHLKEISSNKFDKILDEVYITPSFIELENKKRKAVKMMYGEIFVLVSSLIVFAIILFTNFSIQLLVLLIIVEAVIFLIMLFTNQMINTDYESIYRELTIKPILKSLYPKFELKKDKASDLIAEYIKLNFDNLYFPTVRTENCSIRGYIENFNLRLTDLSSIRSSRKFPDEVVFSGIFANTNFNRNIGNTKVLIMHNVSKSKRRKYKVDIMNKEFQEFFKVYSEDSELAIKIISEDIINSILDFYQKSKLCFDVVITGEQIYFRFFTGNVFKPDILNKEIDKASITLYFDILEFIVTITKEINSLLI